MKILIPVVGFGRAGGERVLARVATELINIGHTVYIVAPDNNSNPYYPTSAIIYRSPKETKYNKYINYIATLIKLYKKCKELNPDIVIANYNLTAYVAWLLPRSVVKVYYIQANEVIFGSSRLRKCIAYLSYLLPLNKIVNSVKLLPNNVNNYKAVIPAGLDTQIFFPRDCNNVKKNIGIIGRKEKHKGTSEVIKVLIEWGIDKKIILNVGVYLDEKDEQRLKKAGIEYNHTAIDNDSALSDFYRKNDLVIATGLVEDGAFHYPCAEAMACGCLVISNYAPLADTDSLLKVDSFSHDKMLEKLDLFYSLDSKQITRELTSNLAVSDIYSWDKIGKKFDEVLCSLKNKENEKNESR